MSFKCCLVVDVMFIVCMLSVHWAWNRVLKADHLVIGFKVVSLSTLVMHAAPPIQGQI